MPKFQMEPMMQWNIAAAAVLRVPSDLDGHCLFEIHLQELAVQTSTCKAACSLPTIDFGWINPCLFWSRSIVGVICSLMSSVSCGRVLR